MKTTTIDAVENIPACEEGKTLILFYEDGEVVATQDWAVRERIEIYNYNKEWYDYYLKAGIAKIVVLEEENV
jgi:hypothetical protein